MCSDQQNAGRFSFGQIPRRSVLRYVVRALAPCLATHPVICESIRRVMDNPIDSKLHSALGAHPVVVVTGCGDRRALVRLASHETAAI